MNQSTLLTGVLLAAFVLFLAAKNRLVTYANVLWGSQTPAGPAPTPNTASALHAPGTPTATAGASTPAAMPSSTPSSQQLSSSATATLKAAFTQMGNGSAQQDIPWADTAESVGLSLLGF